MKKSQSEIEEILYREGLKVASFSQRFFAFIIDQFLLTLITFIAFWSATQGMDFLAIRDFLEKYVLLPWILYLIYYMVFTYFYGASIGKLLLKIRIVQVGDLDIPDLKTTIIRCVCKEVGQIFLFITYFFALGDKTLVRTLHDLLADTIVIKQV